MMWMHQIRSHLNSVNFHICIRIFQHQRENWKEFSKCKINCKHLTANKVFVDSKLRNVSSNTILARSYTVFRFRHCQIPINDDKKETRTPIFHMKHTVFTHRNKLTAFILWQKLFCGQFVFLDSNINKLTRRSYAQYTNIHKSTRDAASERRLYMRKRRNRLEIDK